MARANYSQIRRMLSLRCEFEGNTMRAERDGAWSFGRLPREFIAAAKAAVYVVYSYATPIGWVNADGSVTVPDVRYSKTTSRQQTLCRAWLPQR